MIVCNTFLVMLNNIKKAKAKGVPKKNPHTTTKATESEKA